MSVLLRCFAFLISVVLFIMAVTSIERRLDCIGGEKRACAAIQSEWNRKAPA